MRELIFNQNSRQEEIKNSVCTEYDLIVIGGGITGAGIALDASLRGLKTLLLEKRDFASGTSSKSTKLIHGGLRYLKQLEFGLVRETGLERAVAHKNIPHLVHPETMLLPIVKDGTFSKFTASMAISVYDMLADVEKKDKKKTLSKADVLKAEPLLNKDILKSGISYSEYRTDDSRLTLELVKSARRNGAVAFNYMKVDDFVYQDKKLVAVSCTDRVANQKMEFRSQYFVSAAGPWVDKLRQIDGSTAGKSLHLTKGVHIVVNQDRLPLENAVYFDDFEGRMIFAIPRGKVTYIGTSDTTYKHNIDRILCTTEDMDYLLEKTNKIFPEIKLSRKDVVSTWAGLRPLIHEDGKSPSELSRKDEIFESETGLISIAGGKLTGFRKMAKKVVNLVLNRKGEHIPCKTKKFAFHADSFRDYKEYQSFIKELEERFSSENLSSYDAWYLASTYGKTAVHILEGAKKREDNWAESLMKSEIDFVINYESCYKPSDYFNRRSGRLYFDVDSVKENLEMIVDEFARHLNWDENKREEMMKESEAELRDVTMIGEKDAE